MVEAGKYDFFSKESNSLRQVPSTISGTCVSCRRIQLMCKFGVMVVFSLKAKDETYPIAKVMNEPIIAYLNMIIEFNLSFLFDF